mmetsp:Transcript_7753/g.25452  ORF Transcript_7753/g.25452 Transcript_7753/m.25452 type:complete len:94 (-) Transcript_7753:127-408(-)
MEQEADLWRVRRDCVRPMAQHRSAQRRNGGYMGLQLKRPAQWDFFYRIRRDCVLLSQCGVARNDGTVVIHGAPPPSSGIAPSSFLDDILDGDY